MAHLQNLIAELPLMRRTSAGWVRRDPPALPELKADRCKLTAESCPLPAESFLLTYISPIRPMDHILSIVLFTPLAGLLVLLFIPSSNRARHQVVGQLRLFPRLPGLPAAGLPFDRTKDFQFVENRRPGFPPSAPPTIWASTASACCW